MKARVRKNKKAKGILIKQKEGKLLTNAEVNFINKRKEK